MKWRWISLATYEWMPVDKLEGQIAEAVNTLVSQKKTTLSTNALIGCIGCQVTQMPVEALQ
jgi:hypothetical protein